MFILENSGKTMSEYFKNLSKTAKSSEWVDDVSNWPVVEFGQNICVLDRFAWFIHPRDNESLQFPRSISAIFQRLGENMLPTGGQ